MTKVPQYEIPEKDYLLIIAYCPSCGYDRLRVVKYETAISHDMENSTLHFSITTEYRWTCTNCLEYGEAKVTPSGIWRG